MVRSQIGNLTFDLSFGHNLCFKYPNESCEPILDIYVSRAFQRYKELFNLMNCWLLQSPSKNLGFQHPKWEPTWECVGSFPHTLLHFLKHEMWFPGFIFGLHFCKPLPWSWAQGEGCNIPNLFTPLDFVPPWNEKSPSFLKVYSHFGIFFGWWWWWIFFCFFIQMTQVPLRTTWDSFLVIISKFNKNGVWLT